jgi:hypothetical protein
MKTCQTRYCRHLLAHLSGTPLPRWTLGQFARTASLQTAIQSSGFLLLPLAMLITLPFGWVYAAYQSATVLDNGKHRSTKSLISDSIAQAKLWPRQNHIVIWLLSPFLLLVLAAFNLALIPFVDALSSTMVSGMLYVYYFILYIAFLPLCPFGIVIALNLWTGAIFAVMLLHTLFGVETLFSQVPQAASNTTFTTIICGFTYLVMDPLIKAAYVLRCFHGASLRTGEDLRVALANERQHTRGRSIRRAGAAGLLILALLGANPAVGQDKPTSGASVLAIDSAELKAALEDELDRARYTWRMPRKPDQRKEAGPFRTFIESIAEGVNDFFSYIRQRISDFFDALFDNERWTGAEGGSLSAMGKLVEIALVILCVLFAGLLLVLGLRVWQRKKETDAELLEMAAGEPVPDIEDDSTSADALPEEGWLTMARDLFDKGQFRLALRALFLAVLARLAHQQYVRIARFKSNQDYRGELARHVQGQPAVLRAFEESMHMYEAVWYGALDASDGTLHNRLYQHLNTLRVDSTQDVETGHGRAQE